DRARARSFSRRGAEADADRGAVAVPVKPVVPDGGDGVVRARTPHESAWHARCFVRRMRIEPPLRIDLAPHSLVHAFTALANHDESAARDDVENSWPDGIAFLSVR